MKIPEAKSYKYRGRLFGWGSSPDADWRVMFSVFALLLIVVAGAATLVFMRVRSGDFGIKANGEDASILDKEALRRTANFYEKRKIDFEAFRTMPETSPDPSI